MMYNVHTYDFFNKKNHSTELFKIFFSLLTLSTAFLQKTSGPGKKWDNLLQIVLLDFEGNSERYFIHLTHLTYLYH